MKKLLCAAVLAACVSSPALADAPSGARIEAHVGWDRPGAELDYDDGVDQFSVSGHDDGLLYGGEIGYDHAVGAMSLGIYAGLDMSDAKRCEEVFGDDAACLKIKRNITAGVRAGGMMGNWAMLYVKGGYSNGRARVSYQDFIDPTNNDSLSKSRGGWHLGAGLETALGSNAYAKVEYVYTDYKNFSDGVTSLGFDRSQIIGGIGFRFGPFVR